MANNTAMILKLKYNITVPEDVLAWMESIGLTTATKLKHQKELQQGYGYYCHWRDAYKRFPEIRFRKEDLSQEYQQALKIVEYIVNNIGKAGLPETDKEYFSIYLKIALDQVLAYHWALKRDTTAYTTLML